ncbi:AhpC/TSA family protein [Planctomycetes bacterium CA13]|uniref:AhpC/TSA family protein n=1 Tax=Novipirellula herctigrandis TaxID=2527986 RepID=A0A5C5Z5Z6_9BACT|nr:AhpC/TSA family protein [Planctomycetes bacterium CA13]
MKSILRPLATIMLLATAVLVNADEPAKTGPLAVGDKAINFELPIIGENSYVNLEDEIRKGPVVVVVLRGYPGYQCPLCNQQVSSLINRAKKLAESCQRVILVYPGKANMLEQHAEEFMGSRSIPDPMVMVRDDAMKMVTEWGIRWNSPRETAYPATYVINQNGRVAWSKISDSHAGRSRPEEILQAIRKLEK